MLLGEILIVGAFAAALVTALGCFAYLVYATLLERHLLRNRSTRACVGAAATPSPSIMVPDRQRRAGGRVAVPAGRR